MTSRVVNDFYWMLKRMLFFRSHSIKELHADSLPNWYVEAARATLRRADKALLRKLRLKRQAATRLLEETIAKFSQNGDGTWKLGPISKEAANLFDALVGWVVSYPAFDGERLISDFCYGLKSCNLLPEIDIPSKKVLRAPLSAFAASLMHQRTVELPDKTKCILNAGLHLRPPENLQSGTSLKFEELSTWRADLDVMVAIPTPETGVADTSIGFPVFRADITLQDVYRGPISSTQFTFQTPLEYVDGKLQPF
jgi:hypothetical protein